MYQMQKKILKFVMAILTFGFIVQSANAAQDPRIENALDVLQVIATNYSSDLNRTADLLHIKMMRIRFFNSNLIHNKEPVEEFSVENVIWEYPFSYLLASLPKLNLGPSIDLQTMAFDRFLRQFMDRCQKGFPQFFFGPQRIVANTPSVYPIAYLPNPNVHLLSDFRFVTTEQLAALGFVQKVYPTPMPQFLPSQTTINFSPIFVGTVNNYNQPVYPGAAAASAQAHSKKRNLDSASATQKHVCASPSADEEEETEFLKVPNTQQKILICDLTKRQVEIEGDVYTLSVTKEEESGNLWLLKWRVVCNAEGSEVDESILEDLSDARKRRYGQGHLASKVIAQALEKRGIEIGKALKAPRRGCLAYFFDLAQLGTFESEE